MLYLFDIIVNNINPGESYEKLPDHIQINLTSNNKECPLRSEYRIQNEYGDIWTEKLRIIEINLIKLLKKIREDDKIQVEYRYTSLVCLEKEDFERYKDRDEDMGKFFGILKDTNEDKSLLYKVDYEEEQKSWEATFMDHGKQIGIEEGSNQKSIEIARNMLNKNLDIELISEVTGLSISEIEKIK